MDNFINHTPATEKDGAAVAYEHIYSATELAEMFNGQRDEFLRINFEKCTQGWDLDYIYDFLSSIEDKEKLPLLQKWLVTKWKYYHNRYATYSQANSRTLKAQQADFEEELARVVSLVHEKWEYEKYSEELNNRMAEQFFALTDSTPPPTFTDAPPDNPVPQYHLSDLSDDVRAVLAIQDDETYSQFVDILKNEVRPWIQKMRKGKGTIKKWNAVKFICVLRGIVRRLRDSVQDWVDLLNEIFKGEQTFEHDAINKYSDANNKNNYEKYDSLPDYETLKADGKVIEAMLKPVIDRMAS